MGDLPVHRELWNSCGLIDWWTAVHGTNHASFTLVIAHGSKERAARWEIPRIRQLRQVVRSLQEDVPGRREIPDSKSLAGET